MLNIDPIQCLGHAFSKALDATANYRQLWHLEKSYTQNSPPNNQVKLCNKKSWQTIDAYFYL